MEGARKQLANIVGRDTANLDKEEIQCAHVLKVLAENIVDGIISPLFYAFIGGAPLAMAYKAVNTMDSMIGYKNKKYIKVWLGCCYGLMMQLIICQPEFQDLLYLLQH